MEVVSSGEESRAPINEGDWLAALEQAQVEADNPDGMTTGEIAEAVGHSRYWVRKRLTDMQRMGRLVVNERRTTNLAGKNCLVPVYMVKPE